MLTFIYVIFGVALIYLLACSFLTYVVQQFPRNPVKDPPDWGKITDTIIPAEGGGSLEVWRIDPEGEKRGIVVFAHGWGRNRDRMVGRARVFAGWGFTAVIHSARDHGNSSPKRLMNAVRFSEDIEAVLNWVGEPVILYGHSAGSAGAIIAASRCPSHIRALFLEASYSQTKPALKSLYSWVHPAFGKLFAPTIIRLMDFYYRGALELYDPSHLAKQMKMPVMIIHGSEDHRFPVRFAKQLKNSFDHDAVSIYIAEGAGHSDSSLTPGYAPAVKAFLDRYLAVS